MSSELNRGNRIVHVSAYVYSSLMTQNYSSNSSVGWCLQLPQRALASASFFSIYLGTVPSGDVVAYLKRRPFAYDAGCLELVVVTVVITLICHAHERSATSYPTVTACTIFVPCSQLVYVALKVCGIQTFPGVGVRPSKLQDTTTQRKVFARCICRPHETSYMYEYLLIIYRLRDAQFITSLQYFL